MLNGVCPVCQSNQVYTKIGGIEAGTKQQLRIDAGGFAWGFRLQAYVCAACGYVAFGVPSQELATLQQFLEGQDWQRFEAPSASLPETHPSGLLDVVVQKTIAVLLTAPDQRKEWYLALKDYESLAQHDHNQDGVVFFQTLKNLLATQGNPAGLGSELRGIYAETWAKIIQGLS